MAKVSLKPEDADKMDFSLDDFTEQERTTLAGWYKHFTHKYPVVGTLKEYDGWDFSSVEEEAKSQTPFGAPAQDAAAKTEAAAAEAIPESESAETKQEVPKDGWVLRPGARVMLKDLDSRADLNGTVGVLQTFDQDLKMFRITVSG